MIEVNLIPDIKREFLRTKLMRNFVITLSMLISGVAIVVLAILGTVVGAQLVAEGSQDKEIKKQEKILLGIEDLDKTVTLQHQLGTIGKMHQDKNIDSRLFNVLSAINPAEQNYAKISNLKYDPSAKTILLEGWTEDHVSLEAFKKTILNTKVHYFTKNEDDTQEEPLAEKIESSPSSLGLNSEGKQVLRFSFSFVYPDELFMNSDKPVVVEALGKKTDVTDSKLGVPSNLFESQANDEQEGK